MNKSKSGFMNKQRSYQLAGGAAALGAAGSASAAIDVAPIVATLSDGIAACTAIGVALLTVWAVKKVYAMIKG